MRDDVRGCNLAISDSRRAFIERVVEIETGHHEGELSKRLLRYAELMEYKPLIDKIVEERGYKYVEQYSLAAISNEEIEDAIDLHIENLETDEVFLSRYYVWSLCMPTVFYSYFVTLHAYIDNCRIYKDLKTLQDTFFSISYEHYCRVLEKHVKYLLAGRFGDKKGALTYILRKRLTSSGVEDFIELEFGPYAGFLTKNERNHEKAKERYYWAYGHEPSLEELAEFLGESIKTVTERDERVRRKKYPIFFDELNAKGTEIYEKCNFNGKPQEGLIYNEVWADTDIVKLVRKYLPKDLRQIVSDRYGFGETGEVYTLKQIAGKMGTTAYYIKMRIMEAHEILRPHLIDYVVHS